jgi:hypothetical protein
MLAMILCVMMFVSVISTNALAGTIASGSYPNGYSSDYTNISGKQAYVYCSEKKGFREATDADKGVTFFYKSDAGVFVEGSGTVINGKWAKGSVSDYPAVDTKLAKTQSGDYYLENGLYSASQYAKEITDMTKEVNKKVNKAYETFAADQAIYSASLSMNTILNDLVDKIGDNIVGKRYSTKVLPETVTVSFVDKATGKTIVKALSTRGVNGIWVEGLYIDYDANGEPFLTSDQYHTDKLTGLKVENTRVTGLDGSTTITANYIKGVKSSLKSVIGDAINTKLSQNSYKFIDSDGVVNNLKLAQEYANAVSSVVGGKDFIKAYEAVYTYFAIENLIDDINAKLAVDYPEFIDSINEDLKKQFGDYGLNGYVSYNKTPYSDYNVIGNKLNDTMVVVDTNAGVIVGETLYDSNSWNGYNSAFNQILKAISG